MCWNIHSEFIDCEGKFFTPIKRFAMSRVSAMSRVRVNPDSFDREVIRRAVHAFYEKKEYPTLSCILMKVKEDCISRRKILSVEDTEGDGLHLQGTRQQTMSTNNATYSNKDLLTDSTATTKTKQNTCLHRQNMG